MKAMLVAVLLTVCAAASGQTEEESVVLGTIEGFFAALREARGEDAAALYSTIAMEQVEITFQSILEGIRRNDESVILRLQSAGYQAEPQEIRGWTTREYLARTLSLPIMFGRYTPFSMQVDSISIQDRRATILLRFENAFGTVIEQQATMVREDDAWLVESFMGMTSFP